MVANQVDGSISIAGVRVGLLEACLTALEHLLTKSETLLWFAGIVVETAHEGIVLGGTFLLDDEHAGSCLVLSREPN